MRIEGNGGSAKAGGSKLESGRGEAVAADKGRVGCARNEDSWVGTVGRGGSRGRAAGALPAGRVVGEVGTACRVAADAGDANNAGAGAKTERVGTCDGSAAADTLSVLGPLIDWDGSAAVVGVAESLPAVWASVAWSATPTTWLSVVAIV